MTTDVHANMHQATPDQAIDLAIDKTHLKDDKQIYPHIVKQYPDVSEKRLRKVNSTRPKDEYSHRKKDYYYPIFSTHPYAFQIDLLEQSANRDREEYPAYYIIIINVNTKYGYAIPIENKDKETIHNELSEFIRDHRMVSITCDEESAFKSKRVIEMLSANRISIKFITDKRHSALSLVDRFIKQLRDMNTPTVHTQRQSDNPKYRDFSRHRMEKLINIYNTTIHPSTGVTPQEMEDDPLLEEKFIIKKLYQKERRRKITDFELEPGTFVRYILPKDPNKKHRYKVSPEAYQISHKDGNAYSIMAADGTTKTVARWRLFPLGKTLPEKMKFANTFHNNMGTVSRIIDYDEAAKKYTVEFAMPDGSTYQDRVSERIMRGATPQLMTDLEKRYFKGQR